MTISLIITVCNRLRWLRPSLESAAKWLQPQDQLVLVDFGSTDGDVEALAADMTCRVLILKAGRPFMNCYGLNLGAAWATGDVLLFSHAEMLYPPNFREKTVESVQPGQCWFPKFSVQTTNHKTATRAGFKGICAFTREDFSGIPWDESLDGYHGDEDTELYACASERLVVYRRYVHGLLHMWHPEGAWRTRYYNRDDGTPAMDENVAAAAEALVDIPWAQQESARAYKAYEAWRAERQGSSGS